MSVLFAVYGSVSFICSVLHFAETVGTLLLIHLRSVHTRSYPEHYCCRDLRQVQAASKAMPSFATRE